jgi:hypothetical protein
MSTNYVNLNQGVEGVGRDAGRHGDIADAHNSRAQRTLAQTEGLRGPMQGSAAVALQNVGMSRSSTSAGLTKQSGDIGTRYGEAGREQAITQDDATQTGVSTHKSVDSVANDVISTRLNAG